MPDTPQGDAPTSDARASDARVSDAGRPHDRWLDLLLDVALVANAAESMEAGLSATLAKVCVYNGWYAACASVGTLPREIWWIEPTDPAAATGLPAATVELAHAWTQQVTVAAATQAVADFGADGRLDFELPGESPSSGGAIATPLRVGSRVVGAALFFSRHSLLENPGAERLDSLLRVVESVGTQMGRIFERWLLMRRIAEEGEREREMLGREVHDGLAQQLVGAKLLADNLRHREEEGRGAQGTAAGPTTEAWDQLTEALAQALTQARALARGLSLDRLSESSDTLLVQLEDLAEATRTAHGVECDVRLEGRIELAEDMVRTQLMRIAREAVYNALRHADPTRIDLHLSGGDGGLVLEIRDDGSGLPENPERTDGMGLASMRYRAALIDARLEIESEAGEGTTVRCILTGG